jgi:hypothetical protein
MLQITILFNDLDHLWAAFSMNRLSNARGPAQGRVIYTPTISPKLTNLYALFLNRPKAG